MRNVLCFAACLALAQAAPISTQTPGGFTINFYGADGASYTVVAQDGVKTLTGNDLYVSSITTNDIDLLANCDLTPVQPVLVEGSPGTWAIGPPSPISAIQCWSGSEL